MTSMFDRASSAKLNQKQLRLADFEIALQNRLNRRGGCGGPARRAEATQGQ
jgi:hypothetical protein